MSNSMDALANFRHEYDRLSEKEKQLNSTLEAVENEIEQLKRMLDGREQRRTEILRDKDVLGNQITGSSSAAANMPGDRVQNLVKQPRERGVHSAYPIINDRYPNIVRIAGKLVAVSCFVAECRANAKFLPKPQFFRGLHGLQGHVVRKHHDEIGDIDVHGVARRCTKVELNDADAWLLEHGRDPGTRIELVYSREDDDDDINDTLGRSEVQTRSQGEAQINELFPHVVKIDGQWVELSCKQCGANASRAKNRYFNGVFGFKLHYLRSHHLNVSIEETLDCCSQRPISNRDVLLMTRTPPLQPQDVLIRKRFYDKNLAEDETIGSDEIEVHSLPQDDGSGENRGNRVVLEHRRRTGKAPKLYVEQDDDEEAEWDPLSGEQADDSE